MNVNEIMTKDLVMLQQDENCISASKKMEEYNIGDVLVQEGDKLIGIVTDRDIALRCIAKELNPSETNLGEVASLNPLTITPETPVQDASELMSEKQVRRLPVINQDKKPIGIISLGDLAVDAPEESAVEEALEEISQPTR